MALCWVSVHAGQTASALPGARWRFYSDLWQYKSLRALSSSMRVLFWFSSTATRFSRHLTYSFFFLRHSRAASLHDINTMSVCKRATFYRPSSWSLNRGNQQIKKRQNLLVAALIINITATTGTKHPLVNIINHIPVFHEPDFPFACDLLSASTWAQCRWSCHDDPGSDGAGGCCADLIGLDVTRGSWWKNTVSVTSD